MFRTELDEFTRMGGTTLSSLCWKDVEFQWNGIMTRDYIQIVKPSFLRRQESSGTPVLLLTIRLSKQFLFVLEHRFMKKTADYLLTS